MSRAIRMELEQIIAEQIWWSTPLDQVVTEQQVQERARKSVNQNKPRIEEDLRQQRKTLYEIATAIAPLVS